MKSRLANLAILISLSGSLAFAGEKSQTTSDAQTDAQSATAAATSSGGVAQPDVPCNGKNEERNTKTKGNRAPSQQEQEFEHMLMGIYG